MNILKILHGKKSLGFCREYTVKIVLAIYSSHSCHKGDPTSSYIGTFLTRSRNGVKLSSHTEYFNISLNE